VNSFQFGLFVATVWKGILNNKVVALKQISLAVSSQKYYIVCVNVIVCVCGIVFDSVIV
jgi:hypothetical protein